MIKRRDTLALAAASALHLGAPAAPALAQGGSQPLRVLRYSFPSAESGFDPAQISDAYSRTVAGAIFEGVLEYAYLSKPARVRPATAAALPEISDDFKTFTVRIQPSIYFADDPAFKGVRRELVAEDYVYSIKRHYDPRWKSGALFQLENARILGLSELRRKLLAEKKPFDYDAPVEGLRATDRYTFQVRLAEPDPRFLQIFVGGSVFGAIAREVVEFYGDKVGEHPVGTGPFRLKDWKRSSRMVLARNPGYREVLYDESPPEGDARLQKMAADFKGCRLPLVDEVHVSVIEEQQPRWLSFLNEEMDMIENVPAEFANIAFPNNRIAPNLAKRGIQMGRYARAQSAYTYFAMEQATSLPRWRCAARSAWRSMSIARSGSSAAGSPSRRRGRSRPRPSATTRRSRAR